VSVATSCEDRGVRRIAVLFDFYGTLAESDGTGLRVADVLTEHGYELPDDVARRYWQDGLDGIEHDAHSISREHYVAWQTQRLHGLLGECGVERPAAAAIIARLQAEGARPKMRAYDDAAPVLARLHEEGVVVAVCSNWDWDLAEAIEEAGLTAHIDVLVSSAWVGARKPHPRIYLHALGELGVEPSDVLFVGDTWNCDVDGPLAHGMRPIYVRRAHREPDHTAPAETPSHVVTLPDLKGIIDLVTANGTAEPRRR
jgi:putative hydrolase of the HAD superfamily